MTAAGAEAGNVLLAGGERCGAKEAQAWPERVVTTSVLPAQVGACGDHLSAAERRTRVLLTVAELMLLSESRVLVLGRSRFPVAALLLSRSCRQSFHLFLDRRCRRGGRSQRLVGAAAARSLTEEAVPMLDMNSRNRRAMRCIGTDGAYTARRLQDGNGQLLQDGMVSMF